MMKRHRITVRLNWNALNKDVQDKAYRMVRLTKLAVEDEGAADRLESELSLTDEDMALLRRAMAQALAEVATMCRDYLWTKKHTSDNATVGEESITLTLMMPSNWNLAGTESLGQMIHAYLAGKAMLEWFRYTVPTRAAEQEAICQQARKEIGTILNARVREMREGESVEVIVGDDDPKYWYREWFIVSDDVLTSVPARYVTDGDAAVEVRNDTAQFGLNIDDGEEKMLYVGEWLGSAGAGRKHRVVSLTDADTGEVIGLANGVVRLPVEGRSSTFEMCYTGKLRGPLRAVVARFAVI